MSKASVNKPNGGGIKRIINATLCSFKGFKAAWQFEAAFRQELLLVLLLLPFSFILADSINHWLILFFGDQDPSKSFTLILSFSLTYSCIV